MNRTTGIIKADIKIIRKNGISLLILNYEIKGRHKVISGKKTP